MLLLQGHEESQGLFVTTGGLDMLLTRTMQHLRHEPASPTAAAAADAADGSSQQRTAAGSSSGGSGVLVDGRGLSRRELAVQLLLFLQLLEHWVIAEAVKAGGQGVWIDTCALVKTPCSCLAASA
jgi:hypothetical protein